jgi:DNA-binding transcriptional ArsR family regulator
MATCEGDPAAAFEALADETRVAILDALAEHRREKDSDPDADTGLSFSELRRAVGAEDSGGFNYHLDRLRDRFVYQDDDGYHLTYAGVSVVAAIRSGTYGEVERDPRPVEGSCPFCDANLTARYRHAHLRVTCENDHTVFGTDLPPGVVADRSLEAVIYLGTRRVYHALELGRDGVCVRCYGPAEHSLDTATAFADESIRVFRAQCDWCGTRVAGGVTWCVLTHPAVVAFHHEHGVDLRNRFPWTLDLYHDEDAVTELSADPLRLRVDAHLGGDELRVTLDEDGAVLDAERA